MAEVYRRVNGRKLTKIIAYLPEMDAALDSAADEMTTIAKRQLGRHRFEGHSEILHLKGDLDHYVVLSDDRGYGAAMSIEFGRDGSLFSEDGKPITPMDPVAPLRTALGMVGGKGVK